jgi:hypothetical protein
MTQTRLAARVGLTADARAVYTALVAVAAAGRANVRHSEISQTSGLNVFRLAAALGELERTGCLPTLRVCPAVLMFAVCDGTGCACLTARGAA